MGKSFLILYLTFVFVTNTVMTTPLMDYNTTEPPGRRLLPQKQPLKGLSNSTIFSSNTLDNNSYARKKGTFDAIVQFEKILADGKTKLLSPSPSLSDHEADRGGLIRSSEDPQTSEICLSHIEHVITSVKKGLRWALERFIWGPTLTPNPTVPSPEDWGWNRNEQGSSLAPYWINLPEESKACWELIKCGSKTSCIKMIDAAGKPSSGILRGNDLFLGDFDQCMDLETGQDFDGRYCTTNIVISEIQNTTLAPKLQFLIGVCFPSSCEAKDVEKYINAYLQSHPDLSAIALQTNCQERHLSLSTKAKVVICICSIFVTLLLTGTFYDAFYKRWWLELERHHNSSQNETGHTANGLDKVHSEHDPIIDPRLEKPKSYTNYQPATKEKSSTFYYDICDKVLMSFSVCTNTVNLFTVNSSQNSIDCLHGMRFISMTWIVLLHVMTVVSGTIGNVDPFLDKAYSDWTFMPIIRAVSAVDTFFAMSGLLLTYVVLRKLKKEDVTPKYFGNFYFHRLLRLTPPYMLILMTYVPLFKYLSDGPFWPQDGIEIDECEDTWWTNLLYLNNFLKTDKTCMLWSWYLANDLQFYLVSPLIFLPMLFYEWKGLLAALAFLLTHAVCAGVITSAKDIITFPGFNLRVGGTPGQQDYISDYYFKPYNRIGPFVIGMVTGFLLLKSGRKACMSKCVLALGWMAATAIALAVQYGLYDQVAYEDLPSTEVSALYNALHSIAWGISVCWVIFVCASGYGGFVNTFLSWKAFIPLSRLTYCAYLVHPLVIKFYFYSQRKPFYMNYLDLSFIFVAVVALSYGVAYIAYLAYEVPITGLEKVVRGLRKKQ